MPPGLRVQPSPECVDTYSLHCSVVRVSALALQFKRSRWHSWGVLSDYTY